MNPDMWKLIIGGAVTIVTTALGSSFLTAWMQSRANHKKVAADADAVVADSASKLVETMRVDLGVLKEEMKELRAENMILQKRVYELEAEQKVSKALESRFLDAIKEAINVAIKNSNVFIPPAVAPLP